MSVFLDTSVIIRYLTRDHPDMFERAVQIIEGTDELIITEGVLGETAFVLSSVYRMSRQQTIDFMVALVERENISTYAMDKAFVLQGLIMCRPSGRVSVADAMLWAAARTAGASVIYTFDERFPSDSVELRS